MVKIELCKCGHFKDDHFKACHNCQYYRTKYGETKSYKVSKCLEFTPKYEAELGKIDDCRLHIEDHGILTISIGFDFGGTHQGFGGYSLGNEKWATKEPVIYALMRFFDVDELEKIIGRYAYAIRDGYKIVAIKKIEFEDKDDDGLFSFEKFFKKYEKE